MLTMLTMVLMAGSPLQMPPAPKAFPIEFVEASARQGHVDEDE